MPCHCTTSSSPEDIVLRFHRSVHSHFQSYSEPEIGEAVGMETESVASINAGMDAPASVKLESRILLSCSMTCTWGLTSNEYYFRLQLLGFTPIFRVSCVFMLCVSMGLHCHSSTSRIGLGRSPCNWLYACFSVHLWASSTWECYGVFYLILCPTCRVNNEIT